MSDTKTKAQRLADRTTLYHGPHAQAMASELLRLDAIEANAVAEIARQRTENAQLTAERDQLRAQLSKAEVNKCALMELLKGILKIDRGTSGRIFIERWQEEIIRTAIAKATGETHEQ